VSKPSSDELNSTLNALFDAERSARKLQDELADAPADAVLAVLTDAIVAANKEPQEEEGSLRLVRIAAVLGSLEGPRAVDGLIDVLASEWPEARAAAGEELEAIAYDRFKEVAQGVERALKRLPSCRTSCPRSPSQASPSCSSCSSSTRTRTRSARPSRSPWRSATARSPST
jgi:hypothetical protein